MNCFPTRAQLNCIRGKQAEKSDESVENPPNNVFPSEIMSFSPDVLRFKFMPTSLNEDAVISVVSTCTWIMCRVFLCEQLVTTLICVIMFKWFDLWESCSQFVLIYKSFSVSSCFLVSKKINETTLSHYWTLNTVFLHWEILDWFFICYKSG